MNATLYKPSDVASKAEDDNQQTNDTPNPCTVSLSTVLANPTDPQYRSLWRDFLNDYATTAEGKEIIEAIKVEAGIDIIGG